VSTLASAPKPPAVHAGEGLLGKPWYWCYVLLALTICYIVNVMDRSQILAASLQAIKAEFGASDFQLGLLSGIPFALFARVGTAIGEAGGSPPSHSLISDYFPRTWRGTAFSFYALAVPVGTALGAFMGGWGNQNLGWRNTFILVGVPGILLALLVRLTVREPPRGMADGMSPEQAAKMRAPGLAEVLSYLWARRSFRHLSLAAALHSVVWYSSGAFNNAFLQRSHQLSAYEAGVWISILSLIAGFGTFLGGFACDRLSTRFNDRRWYLWVPGVATLLCVPFQFLAYLSPTLTTTLPSFVGLMFMAAVFFGPSFAMTQALATVRMRSVATSLLLFIQTLIGNGLGPAATGYISDWLVPSLQRDSLRYALVIIGVVNVWAALHYAWGSRTLRQDLEATEALSVR
jgi:MFS family permease